MDPVDSRPTLGLLPSQRDRSVMKRTDPALGPGERLVELLIQLPENGMTSELGLIQEFLALNRDSAFMGSLDEDLRSAAQTRAERVRRHLNRLNLVLAFMIEHARPEDGSLISSRDRDTFLALAEDEEFLQALPYEIRLKAYHYAYMIRHAAPQQRCCAA